jgi:hypothetical protein
MFVASVTLAPLNDGSQSFVFKNNNNNNNKSTLYEAMFLCNVK